ncbi:hypothetical protein D3C72_1496850 [compost metagenome]
MAAGAVTGQRQPPGIALPLGQSHHDGEGRRQGVVVGRRVDMFGGEAGVHREDQGIGAVAQHPQLAVMGLEIPADEAAAMKVDEGGIGSLRPRCRSIEPYGIVGLLPLLYLADLLLRPSQHGRGKIALAAGLPTQCAGVGTTGGDKAGHHLGDGRLQRDFHGHSIITVYKNSDYSPLGSNGNRAGVRWLTDSGFDQFEFDHIEGWQGGVDIPDHLFELGERHVLLAGVLVA